jgi:hypothetical protein
VRVVGVAVPPGDPVGGGDDIDARLKHFDVEVLVREHTVERHHIRLGGDDLLDGGGELHPVARQAGELARVLADLLRRIAVHANEFEIGLGGDPLDHLRTDVSASDLEDANRSSGCIHSIQPFWDAAYTSAALPPMPSG